MKRIEELAKKAFLIKHPNIPEHCWPSFKYSESSTNKLTKCVIDFLQLSGWQAERISTTGRYIDRSKIVTDVMNITRKIGSGEYIPGTGTRGSADISATIKGRSVKLEIKFGKDRQSEYQKEYERNITNAGGVYFIVRDFDSFHKFYVEFLESIS